jgi:hypothetical protein
MKGDDIMKALSIVRDILLIGALIGLIIFGLLVMGL